MSQQLQELLFSVRQHSAFRELLSAVALPQVRDFKPSDDGQKQFTEHVFRSGRKAQHQCWLDFLTGESTSQQEKS